MKLSKTVWILLILLLALSLIAFAKAVVLWALLLVGLDVLARQFYTRWTTPAQRKNLAILRGEVSERDALPMQPHPYMLYVNTPNWVHSGIPQTNQWGHRNGYIPLECPPETLRVLCLGGSTTYGYLLDNPQDAWPAQLEKRLQQTLNRPVQVINAGLNYATSAEMLTHYVMRQRHFKPHIVILHEGGNDAAPLVLDDYNPEYQGFRLWSSSALQARPFEKMWLKSALVRVLYARWLGTVDLSTLIFEPEAFNHLTVDRAMQNAQLHYPLGYLRNLDTLVKLCKADGATPILFPFVMAPPQVFDVLEPAMTYAKRLYPAIMTGVTKHEQIMRQLAETHQVPLAKLPDGAIPLDQFFDHCHLKPEGEGVKAEHLAQVITASVEH